jgi:uncharacterized membrane protein
MWNEMGPTVIAAFLASFVEFVEALTIVLAVSSVRGWRPALGGAAAGCAVLTILVILLGPLLHLVPLNALRLGVGILLLLFGMRWLRKAILRGAGIIPLHDEAKEFVAQRSRLVASATATNSSMDLIAIGATFQAVVLEGLEVVFIVIAVGGTGGMLIPASIGAAAAGFVVILLGLVVHRPLARVPENSLKFVVGVLISAFGLFWVGEGAGFNWPGSDLAVIFVAVTLFAVALAAVPIARQLAQPEKQSLDVKAPK